MIPSGVGVCGVSSLGFVEGVGMNDRRRRRRLSENDSRLLPQQQVIGAILASGNLVHRARARRTEVFEAIAARDYQHVTRVGVVVVVWCFGAFGASLDG
jgi:hypothetical protein